jgi:hypothetical protein
MRGPGDMLVNDQVMHTRGIRPTSFTKGIAQARRLCHRGEFLAPRGQRGARDLSLCVSNEATLSTEDARLRWHDGGWDRRRRLGAHCVCAGSRTALCARKEIRFAVGFATNGWRWTAIRRAVAWKRSCGWSTGRCSLTPCPLPRPIAFNLDIRRQPRRGCACPPGEAGELHRRTGPVRPMYGDTWLMTRLPTAPTPIDC